MVNCNELILLEPGYKTGSFIYETAVDPRTEKQDMFSVPIVLAIFTVQDVVRH